MVRCGSNGCTNKVSFPASLLLAMMKFFQALFWAVLCGRAWGYHVLTSPDQLNPKKTYDYIIVGGGTAGSVLAARLSENGRNQILAIEAGGRVEDDLAVHIPFLAPSLANSQVDWNYTTTPQVGFRNRTINIARGFVLGGSSCINQMTYHRPSNGSWDHWADLVGDPSLSWKAVQKYWLRTSSLVDPVDGHDTTGQVIPSAHGFGPVNISLFSYPKPIQGSIIETSKRSVDAKFKYNQDNNAGDNLGWGRSAYSFFKTDFALTKDSKPGNKHLSVVVSVIVPQQHTSLHSQIAAITLTSLSTLRRPSSFLSQIPRVAPPQISGSSKLLKIQQLLASASQPAKKSSSQQASLAAPRLSSYLGLGRRASSRD